MLIYMADETNKLSHSDTNPQNSAVIHDFFGGKAPTFPPLNSEKQLGSQLERISCYGPKSQSSVSEVSNQLARNKRSHSDSAFTGSSREGGIPQMIPEDSHVMKMLRSASGADRLRISPSDGPLHGVPHQSRPVSSFLSQTTIGANANSVNSERPIPMNVGGSNMQYNACVIKSSPLLYQVPSSRLRDNSSGPSVMSQLAADEGSRTGNKDSGIWKSINVGSNPVSERSLSQLVPSGCNLKPATRYSEPEPSNPPSSHGLNASGGRRMTIVYRGQVHVFDDVHPDKGVLHKDDTPRGTTPYQSPIFAGNKIAMAAVIMTLAGSNGGSWSTGLPKASARTTLNNAFLAGEIETITFGDRSFSQKYHNILSAGTNSFHGLGFINQGGITARPAGTSGQGTELRLEAKREV